MLPVMPFTEQYARESVPREYWHTERFRSVNRRISPAWGLAIASMAAGHLPAWLFSRVDVGIALPARPLDLAFGWILPIALVWRAVRYTARARRGPATPPGRTPATSRAAVRTDRVTCTVPEART